MSKARKFKTPRKLKIQHWPWIHSSYGITGECALKDVPIGSKFSLFEEDCTCYPLYPEGEVSRYNTIRGPDYILLAHTQSGKGCWVVHNDDGIQKRKLLSTLDMRVHVWEKVQ